MNRRHAPRHALRLMLALAALLIASCGSDPDPASCEGGPFTAGSCNLSAGRCDDYALGPNGTAADAQRYCEERRGTFDATRSCSDFGYDIDRSFATFGPAEGFDVCGISRARDIPADAGTD